MAPVQMPPPEKAFRWSFTGRRLSSILWWKYAATIRFWLSWAPRHAASPSSMPYTIPGAIPGPAAHLDLLACPPYLCPADPDAFYPVLPWREGAKRGRACAVLTEQMKRQGTLFRDEIGFYDIARLREQALIHSHSHNPGLDDILAADQAGQSRRFCLITRPKLF